MKFKRRFYRKFRYNRKRSFMFIFFFLLCMSFGLGYSLISTDLNIFGTTVLKDNRWDVHFDNIQEVEGSVSADEDPTISNDVRLFMNDDDCPNAFATGRKTMCVTQGLLELDDEAIKATLGHEFGHLAHKDTDRILVVRVGNTFISAIAIMFQIGAIIMEWFGYIMSLFTRSESGFLVAIFTTIARVMTVFVINVFLKLWDLIGVALCMKTSRNNEYEADEFSVNLGYANGLIALLSFIGGEKPKGLFATLASSHPASSDRIARIRQITAE